MSKREPIGQVVSHASQKAREPLSKKLIAMHSFLITVSLISPVTYAKPSYADDPPYGLPDHPTKELQVISTWLPTTALLYLACMDYYLARSQNIIPNRLKDILEGLSAKETQQQDAFIGVISLLSAIPLTTPLFAYPLIDSKATNAKVGNAALVAVILSSNAVAHVRPLQIILDPEHPYYGFPVTAYRWIRDTYRECQMTPIEKREKHTEKVLSDRTKQLKQHLVGAIAAKADQLIQDCFVSQRCYFGYSLELTQDFQEISSLDGYALIEALVKYQPKNSTPGPLFTSSYSQKMYGRGLEVAGFLFANLVIAEAVGYLTDTGFRLSDLVDNSKIGWSIAAIALWSFAVLLHNAGNQSMKGNLDFGVRFLTGRATLSWPVKYFAKIYFGLLATPGLGLMLLNASAANVIIRDDYQDIFSEHAINTYIDISRWGFVGLAIFLLHDMTKYLFITAAKYIGSAEVVKIEAFDHTIQELTRALSQIKRKPLVDWLSTEEEKNRTQLLSMSSQKTDPLLSTEVRAPKPRESWCSWFSCGRSAQTHDDGYQAIVNDTASLNAPTSSGGLLNTVRAWMNGDQQDRHQAVAVHEVKHTFEV